MPKARGEPGLMRALCIVTLWSLICSCGCFAVHAAIDEKIAGKEIVAVELNAGGDSPVTITSAEELDEEAIRAAVDEAGYEVK